MSSPYESLPERLLNVYTTRKAQPDVFICDFSGPLLPRSPDTTEGLEVRLPVGVQGLWVSPKGADRSWLLLGPAEVND